MASLKSALATDALDFNDKRSKLKDAEKEQTDGDAELEVAAADLERLESALRDIYEPMKEAAATKAQVKQLQEIAGDFGFDQSLILALPGALSAALPRSTFANVVMQQFENANEKHLAQLKGTLDAGAPAKASQAAAVQTAKEAYESAKQRQIESASALKAAQEEERAAESELKAAKKSLAQLAPEIARAASQCKKDGARLEAFRGGPLQAFKELAERVDEPEPVSAEEPFVEDMGEEVAPIKE